MVVSSVWKSCNICYKSCVLTSYEEERHRAESLPKLTDRDATSPPPNFPELFSSAPFCHYKRLKWAFHSIGAPGDRSFHTRNSRNSQKGSFSAHIDLSLNLAPFNIVYTIWQMLDMRMTCSHSSACEYVFYFLIFIK